MIRVTGLVRLGILPLLFLFPQAPAGLRVTFPGGDAILSAPDLAALPRDSIRAKIHEGPERWYAGPSLLAVLRELAPALGNQRVILVDRIDGKPVPDEEGPWRLLVPGDSRPTRWARPIVMIRLIAAAPE